MASVVVHLGEGTRAEIEARGHIWFADEPVPDGTDQGPTPYELLLGALAACTVVTLRLYAQHKGIKLDSVDVEYEHEKVHAEDCRECESEEKGLLDVIRSKVTIRGEFDDAQKKRLTQVVSRCPVHKTLAKGARMFDAVDFV